MNWFVRAVCLLQQYPNATFMAQTSSSTNVDSAVPQQCTFVLERHIFVVNGSLLPFPPRCVFDVLAAMLKKLFYSLIVFGCCGFGWIVMKVRAC